MRRTGAEAHADRTAHRVVFAPEARGQLIAVYDHVAARSSPDTAYAFTTAIMEHCESFATFPHRGTRRDDLRPGLRVIGFRKRVTIAFSVDGRPPRCPSFAPALRPQAGLAQPRVAALDQNSKNTKHL